MSLKEQIARRISRLYFIAITLIAMLALFSQGFLQLYLYGLSFDSREINLAGKMRMLSQRTVKFALLIERNPERPAYREQLAATSTELLETFDGLRLGSSSLGVPPPPSEAVTALFNAAYPLLKIVTASANQLQLAEVGSPAFEQHLQTIINNDEALLEAIAKIPASYDDIARKDVVRLEWIEIALLLLTLLILALELRFIFRPIMNLAVDALRKTEQEAVESQRLRRMASMGSMSAGIAHELNSPLAALSFAIQRPQRRISRGREVSHEDLQEQLDKMAIDALRMGEVVQSVRALATGKLPEPKKSVAAIHLFERAISTFDQRYGRFQLAVKIVEGADQVCVPCVDYQIEQVLINLIRNAAEATESFDKPWIELSARHSGSDVQLIVRDAGTGIGEDAIERIFDPFYTTKSVGNGLGLGLSLCQRLAELHAGKVLYSLIDGHTAFIIALPQDPMRIASATAAAQEITIT